ncbi:MAG: hypothetical protein FJX77_01370 [Armatimonadetes bacterium]|nr:hypothetical protein [Armatimonadota bacterium]
MDSDAEEARIVNQSLEEQVPGFRKMDPQDQERLRRLVVSLNERGMPEVFVRSSLQSTAAVLQDLRNERTHTSELFQRHHVGEFLERNSITADGRGGPPSQRGERKREERERLLGHVVRLLREARLARGRHELKKTRSMLLKLDQRELRRVLGQEGEDLCRQINTWLRSTAPQF